VDVDPVDADRRGSGWRGQLQPAVDDGMSADAGDVQNLLARVDNHIHRAGMTALWTNSTAEYREDGFVCGPGEPIDD
jgi:hypothetical protein